MRYELRYNGAPMGRGEYEVREILDGPGKALWTLKHLTDMDRRQGLYVMAVDDDGTEYTVDFEMGHRSAHRITLFAESGVPYETIQP